jgi:pilus assembly protein Flp/PilA
MLSVFVHLQTFFFTAYDRLTDDDEGATAVEYGLLVGLIAVALITVLLLLGPKLAGLFTKVVTAIPA